MSITNRFNKILSTSLDKQILGIKKNNTWDWINRKQLKNNIIYCIHCLLLNT